LLSLASGLAIEHAATHQARPAHRARELVRRQRFAEAETALIEAVRRRPVRLPVLVELIDVHEMVVASDPATSVGEGAVQAVLDAPDIPADVAVLVRWWARVRRHIGTDADRVAIVALADSARPVPWANHLLGLEAELREEDGEAADRFAREASEFDDRREDAERASGQWIDDDEWEALESALDNPHFARQVSAGVRLRDAEHRRDWRGALRWMVPSEYEGMTRAVLLLALVSALVWFALCAEMGLLRERPRFKAPLYAAAFVLGALSGQVTMLVAWVQEQFFHFTEKGDAALDVIYYVVGVGLREELSKALLLLPLVPIVLRWGRRREALACGALVGLGFGAEENLGYFHAGLSTALSRFLTANFLHLSTTALVAVAIDDALRGRERREGDLSRTLMLVVVAHGMYDFFLSNGSVGGYGFLSMFVFVLLTRSFVDILRGLPGRQGSLVDWFGLGLAVVTGATFVYACTLADATRAFVALLQGAVGVGIVAYMFFRELGTV
jgi:RsiW-degrading membrane proteinase PrsW (M82 family)